MELQTGIFSELLTDLREKRSSLENPQTPLSYPAEWLLDIFNGGRTDSGIRVSELTAFQAVIFLACVDLIAGTIASLPLHIYERSIVGNGRASHRIAFEHDLYDIIHIEPNPEMSRHTFLKAYMAHSLAWGNAYAELQRDAGNQIIGIWPRNPYKTRPHRLSSPMRLEPEPWRPFPVNLPAGSLVYRTTDGIDDADRSDVDAETARAGRFIPAEDMLHVPGLTFDGRIGQSVVWLARQTLGLALATDKFGAKYFANFARPSGILEMPAAMTPEAKEQARRSWMEAQGGENSHRVAVLPPGFNFKPISNKPEESQMVETKDRLRSEICAVFHVPPHMVGDVNKSTRSSTEQMAQEFFQYTLSPWMNAIKLEWKRKMFPSIGIGRTPKSRFYIDFDITDMLRPDAASREKFYGTGRQWGFLNTNDIRAFEKLNPIDEKWAEDYWMPINMTLTETPLDPNHQDGAGVGDKPDDQRMRPFSRIFRDAFGRIITRQQRDLKAIQMAFGPVLFSIRDAWFDVAAQSLQLDAQPGLESGKFVEEYLAAMQKRAAEWTAESAEETVSQELQRAVRALRIAAYREAASLKAKEGETHAAN
ncbi:MAG TPA: phage portal protein [Alloacidobacterium sp.]|jgi:HK97 family phage portal protein|nr:phage portal protein [Alloacidobacterium sp.]